MGIEKHKEEHITWTRTHKDNLLSITLEATRGNVNDSILRFGILDMQNETKCIEFNVFRHDLIDIRDMLIDACGELMSTSEEEHFSSTLPKFIRTPADEEGKRKTVIEARCRKAGEAILGELVKIKNGEADPFTEESQITSIIYDIVVRGN